MKPRMITEGVYMVGAVDWDRRLFDMLIPIPDGTSYNAYLIKGSQKTVLLDAVEPHTLDVLLSQLEGVPNLDYVVSQHAEQDHSGTIPQVLAKYPEAKVLVNPKGKKLLLDHVEIPAERVVTVADGETLSLGDKTLEFIHTPWVHWPETMCTYLKEDGILFSCDFFGSHLATTSLYASGDERYPEAVRRYFAEIMMPLRSFIQKDLEKLKGREFRLIAPSHGPVVDKPAEVLEAYRHWAVDPPGNVVVIPYVTMHGDTRKMVEHLVSALVDKGVTAYQFDLAVTDKDKLAMALLEAATLVIGTPTVLTYPHPQVSYAASLINIMRPKARYISVIGSYGWGGKAVEYLRSVMPGLEVEYLEAVLCQGSPKEKDLLALDNLAATIAEKHKSLAG